MAPTPLAAVLALTSCMCGSSGPPAVSNESAQTLVLSELSFSELEIPPNSRPEGAHPPEQIPVSGPWRYVGTTRAGMHKYATAVPIRPRGLFFHKPQAGMRLRTADGEDVSYDRFGKKDGYMWSHDRKELIVYQAERLPEPTDGQFLLSYPRAIERENALNLEFSAQAANPGEFAWKTIQDDWDSRRGLLLPAPGHAAWEIEVPPAGELRFVSGLVEPEIREAAGSDGARIVVEVQAGGETVEVLSDTVAIRTFEPQRVDLSRWSGQKITLRVKSEPLANPNFDYVFLAEPVVASRKEDPVRVVMVFIDTLRPDHMSMYGYERDTTAKLDPTAGKSVVFSNARSVAPWTLPSSRTIVTGRHPEYYDSTQTLQETLRQHGYATAFMAGNVYLSTNFDMARDWEMHRVGLWPLAQKVTDDALTWLDEHEGRDALIQVHYMDPHLPYLEPASYRHMYAGEGPDGLREEFHLSDVRKANLQKDPDGQQYLRDRYDNNIRYATDQVARIVERLDDNDILLVYADHGEEFWEHKGFEHGHTLFDELIRVPLMIKAPGVTPASVDAPVSLLDLTPTILDLLAIDPPGELDGTSLVPLLKGEAGADEPFMRRDLAFGRPLYGMERWGVLHEGRKWTTVEGREALYDLAEDPGELDNLLTTDQKEGAAYREYLGTALGRDVGVGYRLNPTPFKGRPIPGLWALCTVPGGFAEAWKGDDPLQNSEATVRLVEDPAEARSLLEQYQVEGHVVPEDGAAVEVCWHPGKFGSREVYIIPNNPLADVGMEMVCSGYLGDANGGTRGSMSISPGRDPGLGSMRTPLNRLLFNGRQLVLQYGIAPIPTDDTQALSGHDDEMSSMLEAQGYQDPEAPEEDAPAGLMGGCQPPKVKLQPMIAPSEPEEAPTEEEAP